MTRLTGLLSEHQRLTAELHGIFAQNQQIVSFVVAAAGVIIAAAMQSSFRPKYPFYWAASLITIGGYRLLCDCMMQIWRIATYMRVYLEPELPGANWETRLNLREAEVSHPLNPKMIPVISVLHWINIGIALAIAVDLNLWPRITSTPRFGWEDLAVAVPLAILAFFKLQERKLARGASVENEQYRTWIELKQRLQ